MCRRTDIHYQGTILRFLGLLTSPSKVVPTLSELNLVFVCLFPPPSPSLLMESKNDVVGALWWCMNCVCGRFLPAGGSFLQISSQQVELSDNNQHLNQKKKEQTTKKKEQKTTMISLYFFYKKICCNDNRPIYLVSLALGIVPSFSSSSL